MPIINTTAFSLRGVHVEGEVSEVWKQVEPPCPVVSPLCPFFVCRTKETLSTGNFLSVINILMQLRKVRVD